MNDSTIGFVGVGLLGSALAERCLSAGMPVLGIDVEPSRGELLRSLGGRPAESIQQVAASCRRIIFSLPDSEVVASVLDRVQEHMEFGTIIIDTTTGDPDLMAGFASRLAGCGVEYLDATIGGSSKQARQGDVIALVGGKREVFDSCRDVFDCFAREAYYVGGPGSGARMKLVLNLVLGLNRAVLAEGLAFARACTGIDLQLALEILKAGPAYSRVMETKGEKMLAAEFSTEARLSQHLKDVRLILATGGRGGAHLPFSSLHGKLLEQLESQGFGDIDNSAIIKAFA